MEHKLPLLTLSQLLICENKLNDKLLIYYTKIFKKEKRKKLIVNIISGTGQKVESSPGKWEKENKGKKKKEEE